MVTPEEGRNFLNKLDTTKKHLEKERRNIDEALIRTNILKEQEEKEHAVLAENIELYTQQVLQEYSAHIQQKIHETHLVLSAIQQLITPRTATGFHAMKQHIEEFNNTYIHVRKQLHNYNAHIPTLQQEITTISNIPLQKNIKSKLIEYISEIQHNTQKGLTAIHNTFSYLEHVLEEYEKLSAPVNTLQLGIYVQKEDTLIQDTITNTKKELYELELIDNIEKHLTHLFGKK